MKPYYRRAGGATKETQLFVLIYFFLTVNLYILQRGTVFCIKKKERKKKVDIYVWEMFCKCILL